MKLTKNKSKVIAAVVTLMLFASLGGLIYMHDNNKTLSDLLDDSNLKAEKLLSEKLSLDKEIMDMNHRISSLTGKNDKLDILLMEANKNLARKEKEIAGINWDRSRTKKVEKELEEVRSIRRSLEDKITALNGNLNSLQSENSNLKESMAALKSQNEGLSAEMAALIAKNANDDLVKSMLSNNYRVDATRGKKDKLTVVAPKTKKITMGFDVPTAIVTDVNFKLITPDGRIVSGEKEGLTSSISDDDMELTASLSAFDGEFKVTKRIQMTYKPDKKLDSGVYKIDVYNDKAYLGSCQIMLR